MNKFIFILFLITFSIVPLTMAIYPGETQTITLTGTIDNWTIEGNLTPIDIQTSGSNAYITIPEDYEPSEFTINFTGHTDEGEITHHTHHSSGGYYYLQHLNQTNQTNTTEINQSVFIPMPIVNEINETIEENQTEWGNIDDTDNTNIFGKPPVPIWERLGWKTFLLYVVAVVLGAGLLIFALWYFKISFLDKGISDHSNTNDITDVAKALANTSNSNGDEAK